MKKKENYARRTIDGKYVVANAELSNHSGKDERLFCFREGEGKENYSLAKVVLGGSSGEWYNIVEGLSKEDAQVFYINLRQNPHLLEEFVREKFGQRNAPPSMKDIEPFLYMLTLNYNEKNEGKISLENSAEALEAILDYGRCEEGRINSRRGLKEIIEELVDAYEPSVDEKKSSEPEKNEGVGVIKQINKPGLTRYLINYIEASRNGRCFSEGSFDESNFFEPIEILEDDGDEPSGRYVNFIPVDEEEGSELGLEVHLVNG